MIKNQSKKPLNIKHVKVTEGLQEIILELTVNNSPRRTRVR